MTIQFEKDHLSTLQPFFLEHLQELLRFPSMYDPTTIQTGAPFGTSIQDALHYMLQLGESEGFVTKDVEGYAGHIEWGHGEDLIGVLGHLDVVPPGEGWSHDPFDPYVKEGKLFARGTQDDKGPVMAAFLAMKWLKDMGVKPKKRIRLILGTDEERGWACMDHYFSKEEMPVVGFSPDAMFPVIHAEKGLIDMEVTKQIDVDHSSSLDLVHFHGGERLNMVPYKATARIEGESEEEIDALFEDFLLQSNYEGSIVEENNGYSLTVTGKSAHAMEPRNGINAIVGLAKFLETLPFSQSVRELMNWVAYHFEDGRGTAFSINCGDQMSGPLTMNLGTLSFVDSVCNVGVNTRYPVAVPFDEWFQVFTKELDKDGASVDIVEHLEPIYLPKDHPFVQKLLAIYEKHTGENLEPLAIGGATYARALNQGVAYGAMFSHSPDTAHNADEHILIDDLLQAAAIYAEALYELVTSDED
ncbi:dipeptidase PepV [Pontibacillus chungwhensis]|uniref:dipeptidase PepV n=1 Tax=Pontibacillus chungwhensis TaxID=265426 RepID=UPI00055E74F6|nr:dipeptidase PepV [Pontibacillus chungwhensis]